MILLDRDVASYQPGKLTLDFLPLVLGNDERGRRDDAMPTARTCADILRSRASNYRRDAIDFMLARLDVGIAGQDMIGSIRLPGTETPCPDLPGGRLPGLQGHTGPHSSPTTPVPDTVVPTIFRTSTGMAVALSAASTAGTTAETMSDREKAFPLVATWMISASAGW